MKHSDSNPRVGHDHGWVVYGGDSHLHREWSLLKDEAFLNTVADGYLAMRAKMERDGVRRVKPFCCYLWSAVSDELRRMQLEQFETGERPIRQLDPGWARRLQENRSN